MDDITKIDLNAEKTEAEWLAQSDRFWIAFTPKLFEWVGWVTLLGAISFVHKKQEVT